MDLDRILHHKKNFAELADEDMADFLRARKFRSEHLNLEFKREFPRRQGSKYDIREFCKYIVGFSNEEGGILIFGVADSVHDPDVLYPGYVSGLADYPSKEDLSQWVKERVHPLVQSPAIRFFSAEGKAVAVVKVPTGANRPYCYLDPATRAITVFKKTAGGIVELSPDEIREFYRTAMLDQAARLLRASEQGGPKATPQPGSMLEQHRKLTLPKLENTKDFGYLGIYCLPDREVEISIDALSDFVKAHRFHFSEAMRFFPDIEVFQSGVSVGYFPRALKADIKSTVRVTLYRNGVVALDAQVDSTMDRDRTLHPYWLSYEIQRHLQLARALLEDQGVERIRVILDMENIQDFSIRLSDRHGFDVHTSQYSGSHEPIELDVALSDIHPFDGDKRNVVSPAVREIMDEVCRIFGLAKTPAGVWHADGYLTYVKGLENQR